MVTTPNFQDKGPTIMVSLYLPIVKFILALKLEFFKPQLSHLFTLVHGIILCAERKNVPQTQQAAKGKCHLSNVTNFLNHSPWCVNRMQRRRLDMVMNQIQSKQANRRAETCVSHRGRHMLQKRQVDQEDGGAKLPVFP